MVDSAARAQLQFPGYENVRLIGYGGHARVYRAHNMRFRRDEAVKVLNLDLRDERSAQSFATECGLTGRFQHPNIVQVFGAGESSMGEPFITMAFASNGTLQDTLTAGEVFDPATTLSIGIKLAAALQTAHDNGVVHRDVKPSNILLDMYGEPKLADFGIARLVTENNADRSLAITPLFAPPELFRHTIQPGEDEDVSPTGDVFSLAATLWALLSGASPFDGDDRSLLAIAERIEKQEPGSHGRDDLPAGLEDVLRTALSKSPHRRPSALEFARWLRIVEADAGLPVTPLVYLEDRESLGLRAPAGDGVDAADLPAGRGALGRSGTGNLDTLDPSDDRNIPAVAARAAEPIAVVPFDVIEPNNSWEPQGPHDDHTGRVAGWDDSAVVDDTSIDIFEAPVADEAPVDDEVAFADDSAGADDTENDEATLDYQAVVGDSDVDDPDSVDLDADSNPDVLVDENSVDHSLELDADADVVELASDGPNLDDLPKLPGWAGLTQTIPVTSARSGLAADVRDDEDVAPPDEAEISGDVAVTDDAPEEVAVSDKPIDLVGDGEPAIADKPLGTVVAAETETADPESLDEDDDDDGAASLASRSKKNVAESSASKKAARTPRSQQTAGGAKVDPKPVGPVPMELDSDLVRDHSWGPVLAAGAFLIAAIGAGLIVIGTWLNEDAVPAAVQTGEEQVLHGTLTVMGPFDEPAVIAATSAIDGAENDMATTPMDVSLISRDVNGEDGIDVGWGSLRDDQPHIVFVYPGNDRESGLYVVAPAGAQVVSLSQSDTGTEPCFRVVAYTKAGGSRAAESEYCSR